MSDVFNLCPDPARAESNVKTFLEENPSYSESFSKYKNEIALLFSYSQFLANFCILYPERLFEVLDKLNHPVSRDEIRSELKDIITQHPDDILKALRVFKKSKLLHITLRDILHVQDTQSTLNELSVLAEVLIDEVFDHVFYLYTIKYSCEGIPLLGVIALGKLGAMELNYSSDVDLMFVCQDNEDMETSNIDNRLSSYEFYAKVIEEFNRLLSKVTEDGFVYRVDLRLRPQGQKGPLVLSIRAYEDYYESWGQIWERAALIRATPIGGDRELAMELCNAIQPFVYRRYIDLETINSIRDMKSQVERIKTDTFSRDIKRGYGGIREIEFFIQIFQLLYGGKEPSLRQKSTYLALHRLLEKNLIGYSDFEHLLKGYDLFRTIENRLQQLNDLQTHLLPNNERDMLVLARKMGFSTGQDFTNHLNTMRQKIRQIYDSLLVSNEEQPYHGLFDNFYWDGDSPIEDLLKDRLSNTKIRDVNRAIYFLMKIRNTTRSFQTLRGMSLLQKTIPLFVDEALMTNNVERALAQIVDFTKILAINEAFLEFISNNKTVIKDLTFVFSHTDYLSRILMSRVEYVESILYYEIEKKWLNQIKKEVSVQNNDTSALRVFKRKKEIKLGFEFLTKKIGIKQLCIGLTNTAEAVIDFLMMKLCKGFEVETSDIAIIGYGKFGARELIFNSDLDIVFVTHDEPKDNHIKMAQALLRDVIAYTKDGYLYKVDTRLRPDGSKGMLVKSIKGLRQYYLNNAQPWEIQALLKARPIAMVNKTALGFLQMRQEVLLQRCKDIQKDYILGMRGRIIKELSKHTDDTLNVKSGRGGIMDIEFAVQYLQLSNCPKNTALLVQNTISAIRRLNTMSIIDDVLSEKLTGIYIFLRVVETLLRLKNETLLDCKSNVVDDIALFMDLRKEELISRVSEHMNFVDEFFNS
ncbi:MAG: bifunctional [glutamate--ammonia ligase]-adenylyl-L-tyrosine phosphorylase/[glutamate--ammonia-ligase] adenylyltransferase [Thermodesulfovibrionales bacterium]|nr:bifunctional [glutamate--ammonia ligase]-adenylyl-L-tyrosine phosphorylase/[glutamate--ammonia-ligase] adenylyltransferase [Thermodesulfovibrionales bacterium]